jgi:molybdenum cofactor biosynthesis enzyme MoaA
MTSLLDSQNTLVVDVTYRCNATCRYCQWGDKSNPKGIHGSLEDVLIPAETIEALGTQRVVLSGGEPRVHPQLETILRYYRGLVKSIIVITNGYGLDKAGVRRLMDNGATGITVSLDSLDPETARITRGTPKRLLGQVISSLREISASSREFELGINSVVSHPTANLETVEEILDFGRSLEADFVKFQPIFDDGYVSSNATDLLLTENDAPELLRIGEAISRLDSPLTNPSNFWGDLATLVSGGILEPQACGLGPRQVISTAGKLSVCYWVDPSSFGDSHLPLSAETVKSVRTSFGILKLGCKVGAHCFCTQNISHEWRVARPSHD